MFRRLFRGGDPPKKDTEQKESEQPSQPPAVAAPPVAEVAPPAPIAAPAQAASPPMPSAVPVQAAPPTIAPIAAPAQAAPPPSAATAPVAEAPAAPVYATVAEYDAAMRAAQPEPPKKVGVLRRLFGGEERTVEEIHREEVKTQQAVEKTRAGLFGRISEVFQNDEPITEELWEEVEDLLIMADVGADTAVSLIARARRTIDREGIRTARQARTVLKQELVKVLTVNLTHSPHSERTAKPYIMLVIGVNGAGKTTLIAKVAKRYKAELGKTVLLAAADTFRAAAVEQLTTWAERIGVPVIAQGQGADPGAVAFDAVQSALSRESDILIIDTAGRLQAKHNLMQELQKIRNVIQKRFRPARTRCCW